MRITESQLRRIIRQEVRSLREVAGGPVEIGRLTATDPTDRRYTDTLTVTYDPADNTVSVAVRWAGAPGGMDTLGSDSESFNAQPVTVPAEPRAVSDAIERVVRMPDYMFTAPGMPSPARGFRWTVTGATGLNLRNVAAALGAVRGGV